MEQVTVRPTPRSIVVRCPETNATKFRSDPQGMGVFIWCKGHHKEELSTWVELGLTREIAEDFLQKEP